MGKGMVSVGSRTRTEKALTLLVLPGVLLTAWDPTSVVGLIWILIGVGLAALFAFSIPLMLMIGASLVTGGNFVVGSLPNSFLFLAVIFIGSMFRHLTMRRKGYGSGMVVLAGVTVAVIAVFAFNPPVTSAGLIAAYSVVLLPSAILVIRLALLEDHTDAFHAIVALAFGLTLSVGFGLLEAWSTIQADGYEQYGLVRSYESRIGSSNYSAGLSGAVGLLLLSIALNSRKRAWLPWALSVPFIIAPVLLLSRGASLAVIVALVFAAVVPQRKNPWIVGASVALVGFAFLLAQRSGLLGRFESQYDLTQLTSGRTELWSATAEMFAANPLRGVGVGGVADALWIFRGAAYTHNLPLQVVAQMGLVLGIFYLFAILPRPLFRWTVVSPPIIFLLADSLVEPMIDTRTPALLYGTLVAMHFSLHARHSPSEETMHR